MARFGYFWTYIHIQEGKINLEIIRKKKNQTENIIVPLCKSVLCFAFCAALHFGHQLSKTDLWQLKKLQERLAGLIKDVQWFPQEERLNRLAFFRLKNQ